MWTNITQIIVFTTQAEIIATIYELEAKVLVAEEQNEIELVEYLAELRKRKIL
ncbi:hypothetical protein [Spiroplasma endosymbiont of Polydrusus formosus]|uniref:hypothetical protein n=1 Tax=Spiroplasma endosymbiont of Polydrusus formosus TaxID=3139326 RepID=UPI0035B51F38